MRGHHESLLAFARFAVFQPQRNLKIRLLADYFARVPDPDRGYGLAALTGTLDFAHAKPALLRGLVGGSASIRSCSLCPMIMSVISPKRSR